MADKTIVETEEKTFDEVITESGIETQVQEKPDERDDEISTLNSQVKELAKQLRDNDSVAYKELRSERDQLVGKYSKTIGFIEGSGLGTYDKNTGEIHAVKQESAEPDKVDILQEKITSEIEKLNEGRDNGDIDDSEYYRKIENKINPMKEEVRELKYDRKFKQGMEDIKKSVTPEQAAEKGEAGKEDKYKAYITLVNANRDIEDKSSKLFQKMQDIYNANPDTYPNANYNQGAGDPKQYAELIDDAKHSLDQEEIRGKKTAIQNDFSTPSGTGYQKGTKSKNNIGKESMDMMVAAGIKSPALLRDINNSLSDWGETVKIVMDE